MHIVNSRLQVLYESLNERVNEVGRWQETSSQKFSDIDRAMEAISKVELGLFALKEQNKAVYQKMASDILEITDGLTLMLSELKPYRQ